jgi:diketogulonate reductase-like aldo/keto reductase
MSPHSASPIPARAFALLGDVPVVGQGTWDLETSDPDQALRALRRGLDLGLTHVDTAEMYGQGRVEERVGQAIAGRRDEVFLVSKVLPQNASAVEAVRACERSLKRLGTDHLDAYLLHWPSEHPLEETLAAFEQLRGAGKIRGYGVSNFDVAELEEAVALAGPGRIVCNQVLHHLGARYVEGALAEACARHGVALVGYSPFGSGRFPSPRSPGGRVLDEIARAHAATPHQVALSFLARRAFTIPKAADIAHVEANAHHVELSDAEDARIDATFPVRGDSLPSL